MIVLRIALPTFLLVALALSVIAQEVNDSAATVSADVEMFEEPAAETLGPRVSVRSNPSGVRVYIDSVLIGTTPIESVDVSEGTHILRYVHSDTKSWLHASIVETIAVRESEHVLREAVFPSVYSITSEPYGASVQFGDATVGQTPLRLPITGGAGTVTLSHPGFEAASVPLAPGESVGPIGSGGGNVHVTLRPLIPDPATDVRRYLSTDQSQSSLPLYVTTGATVVTGALAAYLKIKADDYYTDYRRTGDPRKLDQVRRMDLMSGIALAASELSLFALTYFLFSR